MKSAATATDKQRLLSLRAQLRGAVEQMVGTAADGSVQQVYGPHSRMPIHMADIGSENYAQECAFGVLQVGADTLEEIERALERLEEGRYGRCERCESRIPRSRLNAVPYARLCVACAELSERVF